MDFNKKEQKEMIEVLKNKEFHKAFEVITASNWWDNNTITNDMERENFLFKTYFGYYQLLFTEGVRGIEREEAFILIHQLKNQLDVELNRVKKGDYTLVES